MATYLALIQFYPAVGKLLSDLNGYWNGNSLSGDAPTPLALQRQLDEARDEMRLLTQLLARSVRGDIECRDVSTQTEEGETPWELVTEEGGERWTEREGVLS